MLLLAHLSQPIRASCSKCAASLTSFSGSMQARWFSVSAMRCARTIDEPDQRDEFNILPLGESDIGQGMRMSFISKDMQRHKLVNIGAVSSEGFRLIDKTGSLLFGPIAAFPKTTLSWRVSTPEEITPESLELFFLLQPKLDVLVIGAGDRNDVDLVRKNVGSAIAKQRIGYEIMATEDAIATFNYLNEEQRYVAAALYPPREIQVSTAEYQKFLLEIEPFDVAPLNDRTFGLFSLLDTVAEGRKIGGGDMHIKDICYRIWGLRTEEAKTKEEEFRALREKNQEQRAELLEKKIEKMRLDRYREAINKKGQDRIPEGDAKKSESKKLENSLAGHKEEKKNDRGGENEEKKSKD